MNTHCVFVSSDDADAGEVKKNPKPIRRNRKQAASNKNELKPGWKEHHNSISSHSSGEEEEPVHTCPTPPTVLMESSQVQRTSMNFNDVSEGDTDPKTGNTCDALSGEKYHWDISQYNHSVSKHH